MNNGDTDLDTVPNFADGFDMFGNEGVNAGGDWPFFMLYVPPAIRPAIPRFAFSYPVLRT